MKKVRWIIQDNLIAENDRNQFQEACDKLGIAHVEVIVVPFSKDLPEFPIDDEYENIYYGSTTFMNNLYDKLKSPVGLFYNHETFSMENYINQWGEYMLNCDAKIMAVSEFLNLEKFDTESTVFLRPDGDGKEFDGQTGNIVELKSMINRMMEYENPMKMDSKIVLGPAYNIHREWRNYIVNGKVVTSSRYRNNFRLSKSGEDIPEDMISFVEDRCSEYQPHDVFAMDIAEVMDGGVMKYFIIECGCMNSVGFYHADISKYVSSVTEYIKNKSNI
jgi:hypothetical protein